MSHLDPTQEFTVLAETLPRRKQLYLSYIASGLTDHEASEKLGIKQETVRVAWCNQAKGSATFKRCLELAKDHPHVVEPLKLRLMRASTIDAINDEVLNGYVDKDGNHRPARTGVLEIAAQATKLIDLAPQMVHNQLNVIVQEGMSRMAAEMQRQLMDLNANPQTIDVNTPSEADIKAMLYAKD